MLELMTRPTARLTTPHLLPDWIQHPFLWPQMPQRRGESRMQSTHDLADKNTPRTKRYVPRAAMSKMQRSCPQDIIVVRQSTWQIIPPFRTEITMHCERALASRSSTPPRVAGRAQ